MNIFTGLSTAISGLYTNKKSLDVTAHNISNVNTPNYVRQQVIHSSADYSQLPNSKFKLGTGVSIQEIRQLRNEFLDFKYRLESEKQGYWSAKNSVFEEVQGILNEISDTGLQKVMDKFWNAWEELAKAPDNLTIRGLLRERAVSFVDTVNHLGEQLNKFQEKLNIEIQNKVTEINDIAKKIAKLNDNIVIAEARGTNPNDYRDTRNSLLDRLSQLVSMEYVEEKTGAVNVSIGGKHLVNREKYYEIGIANRDIYWKNSDEKVKLNGGELLGLMDARGSGQRTDGNVSDKVDVVFAYTGAAPAVIDDYKTDIESRLVHNPDYYQIADTDISDIIDYIDSLSLEDNTHKKVILFDNNSSGIASETQMEEYIEEFNKRGVSVTVISDPDNKYDASGQQGWTDLTEGTGGSFFDINNISDSQFAEELSQETTNTLSRHMGTVNNFLKIIPSIKQKLNTFVNTIARNINYIHRQGIALDGDTGIDFFLNTNPNEPIQMGNITLNPDLGILNKISVSKNGDRGNGEIAKEIADLRDSYLFGNITTDDYYRDIVSDIGVAGNEAATMEESQEILISQIENKRESISAVSLDEEMSNMIKYQHSYVANTRVVNAIDEMLDNIINKLGRVGR
ncbi:flagellar hook-associated protein FlgK [Thermohalobacter berrensis]|uniref:Flagellar hook-associated protein 1 n=1 Tax=Thermohalobacter berrensis TaxID=99594 RepID=A0A419T4M2_9FIRM|nr:flagellar hook-associated protein FlgK [Thermohalobacter berrensis]RKD32328.1 flagellar hook-associated protein FlgK [Thermohalobacter berrensis]